MSVRTLRRPRGPEKGANVMADNGRVRRKARRAAGIALPVVAALLVACASASPPAPGDAPSVSAVERPSSAEIRALELERDGDSAYLDVQADAPLMWTSFRDPEGRLVIELPNAAPGSAVQLPETGDLVSAVDLEPPKDRERPVTRVVVTTTVPVEHSVVGEADALRVQLVPTNAAMATLASTGAAGGENLSEMNGSAASAADPTDDPAPVEEPVLAYEPLPAEDELEELAVDEPAEPVGAEMADATSPAPPPAEPAVPRADTAVAGTADDPFVAPPPTGPGATLLAGVTVEETAVGVRVRVEGDGQFDYSTFALANPHRFVIDLAGVLNDAGQASLPVDGAASGLRRVRLGQFRGGPDPVSRVVFDLDAPQSPRIERTAEALLVTFRDGRRAASRPGVPRLAEGMNGNGAPRADAAPTGAGASAAVRPGARDGAAGTAGAPVTSVTGGPSAVPTSLSTPPMAAARPAVPGPQEPDDVPDEEPAGDDDAEPEMERVVENEPEGGVEVELRPEDEGGMPEVQEPAMPMPAEPELPREADPAMGDAMDDAEAGTSDLDLYGGRGIEIETPEPPSDAFSTRTLGAAEQEYVGERLDFSLRDADLVETLRSFAVMSGLNIVIQPGVSGTVTMELRDVPWDQAFEQILKINGLSYEVEGNIMRIAPVSVLQTEAAQRRDLERAKALSVPLTTVIRRLSYAQASQVAGILRAGGGILSQRGNVIVDGRTNTLIIKELPDYIDTVIAVIENLDIPEPLVMIEARIVETRKNFTRTLGIEWSFQGVSSPETGNTTGLQFPNQGELNGGVNLLTGGQNALVDLTLGNVLNTFNLDAALQAAENEGLVNILSAPKVQALNNEQASIQSGFQIPIQTVANNTVSVQFVNATLKLDVTPQVTAEGTVMMDINIQKRNPEFGLTVAGATNAPISTKEAQTRVIVRDGGTTVIGGIYEVTTNQGQDRVPGLANIPIIGHLFKNRRRTDENSELLIFITPRVVKL